MTQLPSPSPERHTDLSRRVERINGIKLPLGTLPQAELESVVDACELRAANAMTDLQVARDYLDTRFPDVGTV